ncbi:MAG: hypothetical protein QXZ44_03095 [Ferroplasma sp.]
MDNFCNAIKPFARFILKNSTGKIYVLGGFYDIVLNNDLYPSINMVVFQNKDMKLYTINELKVSIGELLIIDFRVFYRYQKPTYRLPNHN